MFGQNSFINVKNNIKSQSVKSFKTARKIFLTWWSQLVYFWIYRHMQICISLVFFGFTHYYNSVRSNYILYLGRYINFYTIFCVILLHNLLPSLSDENFWQTVWRRERLIGKDEKMVESEWNFSSGKFWCQTEEIVEEEDQRL